MNVKVSVKASGSEASAGDRAYHHGNLRAAAIAAALEALMHRMPSEISLRELAKQIGVRHSALYVHFRDRDELFAVVSGQGFERLRTALAITLDAPGDKIAALSDAYLRFARSNPAHYRAMYSPANTTEINSSHVDEVCNACFAMLVRAVTDTASVSDDDAEKRAIGIWCTLHGLVQLGGGSGVLRYKVKPEDEATLAERFAGTLARQT